MFYDYTTYVFLNALTTGAEQAITGSRKEIDCSATHSVVGWFAIYCIYTLY
jgi:hypothetical protein